jgi:hypothetical protein
MKSKKSASSIDEPESFGFGGDFGDVINDISGEEVDLDAEMGFGAPAPKAKKKATKPKKKAAATGGGQ